MFIQVVAGFVLMPVVVTHLGPRQYGLWTLIGDTLWYYTLLDLGLSSAVSRNVARTHGQGDFVRATMFASASFGIFCAIAILLCIVGAAITFLAPMVFDIRAEQREFRTTILLLSAGMALAFPVRTHIGILNARMRFDLTALSTIIRTIVGTALMIAAVKLQMGLIGIAAATVAAQIVESLILVACRVHYVPEVTPTLRRIDRGCLVDLLSFSWKSFVAQTADLLRYRVSSFIIAANVGLAPVAFYSVGMRLVDYGSQLVMNVLGLFTPVFSILDGRGDKTELKRYLGETLRISTIASLSVICTLSLFSTPFIEVWMGREYLISSTIVAILAFPMALALVQNPSVSALYGAAKHQYYMFINLAEGLANVILSLWLVPSFGIVGAALGIAIPMTISKGIAQPIIVSRVLHVPLTSVLGRQYWTRLCKVVIPFLAFSLLFSRSIKPSYPSILGYGSLLFVSLLIYDWFFLLRTDERSSLLSWIGRLHRKSTSSSHAASASSDQ